ncbi:MAG: hydrogenase nickel incorporation protein HypB [bacterium]
MSDKQIVEKKVLSQNDEVAAELRRRFRKNRITVLNLVSAPGSGKTALLEVTIKELQNRLALAVIAGDVQTENDALRLRRAGGVHVVPIETQGACHLDAKMVSQAVRQIPLESIELLFIENVGNLVCPASFDLGEQMKVALISSTEGDDKPLKYPAMFKRAGALVITKTDLLGLSDFDVDRARQNASALNQSLRIFELSSRSGEGLTSWFDWLTELVAAQRQEAPLLRDQEV